MDSNTVVWIVIAVVAVIVVIAVVALLARARNNRRHAQAERMREEIGQKTEHTERREAIAAETAARARAAQAEAEVKAAEAARLQGTARTHHDAATASREELDAQSERADALDPRTKNVQEDRPDVPVTDERQWQPEQHHQRR